MSDCCLTPRASSPKQQSPGRHITPLGHNFPDSEPTYLCSCSLLCLAIGEAVSADSLVFGLTGPGSNPCFITLKTNTPTITPTTRSQKGQVSVNVVQVLHLKKYKCGGSFVKVKKRLPVSAAGSGLGPVIPNRDILYSVTTHKEL